MTKNWLFYWRYSVIALRKMDRKNYQTVINDHKKKQLVSFIILLVTISQLAVTIYLPSMPAIMQVFKTSHAAIQFSLTFYLIGYGISQFFYGPLSDIFGRRRIILVGLMIFMIASLACVCATSIKVLLVARVLQGIGIGCGDTMGRAILCDCFKDTQFVKAACRIGLAATVTPLMAPIIGGYIETWLNWRVNFLLILIYGIVSFYLVLRYLPETKPRELFGATNLRSVSNRYFFILRNRVFLGFFIPGLVSFIGENTYNMISPFLIQNELGWTPANFGWLSLFIVAGLLIGTLIANIMTRFISTHAMVFIGLCLLSFSGIAMLLPALFHHLSLITLLVPMMFFMAGVGITYPNTNMGALTPFTAMAGTAGALQGGLQMVIGGVLASLISELPSKTQLPLAMTLTLISLCGLGLFHFLLHKNRPPMRVSSATL